MVSNRPGRFPLKNRLVYSSTRPRAAPRWISPSPFISDTAPGCPRWAPWPRPLEMPCGERHGPVPRPSSLVPRPIPGAFGDQALLHLTDKVGREWDGVI